MSSGPAAVFLDPCVDAEMICVRCQGFSDVCLSPCSGFHLRIRSAFKAVLPKGLSTSKNTTHPSVVVFVDLTDLSFIAAKYSVRSSRVDLHTGVISQV